MVKLFFARSCLGKILGGPSVSEVSEQLHVQFGCKLTSKLAKVRIKLKNKQITFFFARCCLGKVPGGAPFSQLHKGTGIITRTGQLMQLYKQKQIQTKQRQQQIPNCGGREDETDARAVRPNSLARCIE